MAAPPGRVVALYYDSPVQVAVGDFIRTPSGRTYRIETVRVQERGRHVGRQHIGGLVLDPDDPDQQPTPGDVVHPIYWYARPRARQPR